MSHKINKETNDITVHIPKVNTEDGSCKCPLQCLNSGEYLVCCLDLAEIDENMTRCFPGKNCTRYAESQKKRKVK